MESIDNNNSSIRISNKIHVPSHQRTSSKINLNQADKDKLRDILSVPENQTMGMAEIIDACVNKCVNDLKQSFIEVKTAFNDIITIFDDGITNQEIEKYMKLNADIVSRLSQIFGQLHEENDIGTIFDELNTISSKFLDAYNDAAKANRMNDYVKNEKRNYFLDSSQYVNNVVQKTPMHVHFIADIRELFDLAASPVEVENPVGAENSPTPPVPNHATQPTPPVPNHATPVAVPDASQGAARLQTHLKQAVVAMSGASGVLGPTPLGVSGSPPRATSTAVTGAGITSPSMFEPGGYFFGNTNANVAESLDAIKKVKSGLKEEIKEEIKALNKRSEEEMGRPLRKDVDEKDVDNDRFRVPMKDGCPKPAQVALLKSVHPLLFKKLEMGNVYKALEDKFDSDRWFGGSGARSTASAEIDRDDNSEHGFSETDVGTLGMMFMMDSRNKGAQKVLNEWEKTARLTNDGKLVITSNVPLAKPGEREAKEFLVRLFGERIEFREEGLDSMKASIIDEIDALANHMGMDIDALTKRQDELRFEQEQCQLEYKRLSGSPTLFIDGLSIENPAGQSSQYYRWSVLEKEIQTIDKLMKKRELCIGRLKEQITELSEKTYTIPNASLLKGKLGKSLEEGELLSELQAQREKIMESATSMYTQEVSGANSVEAYLAKRAVGAPTAEAALKEVSLNSADAKITLVYERWGRYHGLSRKKVEDVYNSDIKVFLTAVSNSTQDEKMKMTPEETERLKEQLGANTKFFKTNTESKWGVHQAREAPSDVRDLSQKTEKLNDPSAPLVVNEFSVGGERKTKKKLTPTQKKQVRAADVLTRRYKALIDQRAAAKIEEKELEAARQGMASAVKESVQSYATYLAVQMARWEKSDGMSKDALLSPMCDQQADGEWVVRDNIFLGPKETVRKLNEVAKNALDQAMVGNESYAKYFLAQLEPINSKLTSDSSTNATYRTHRDIEMAKFHRIKHTVESLIKKHDMTGITLPPVTQATFGGPTPKVEDSGDRAVFMHKSPEMALLSDNSDIQAKLDEYLRLTSAKVETKAREIMANCGFIQSHLGEFKVDQKIKAIQTRLRIETNYPLTDAERAEFRGILEGLKKPQEKLSLWTNCRNGKTFWDSSALQALCPVKINATALDALFANPNLLNETTELTEASIKDLFQDTDHWTHHDSGLLDAAMMCMPESVRQKVAQYGPSIGQADHVNHQVRSDIPHLFDRYMERLNALDPPPPPGSLNVIDSEFKAMVRLFSANSAMLSEEQKGEMKAIVKAKLSELKLESIKTPAHQEALAVFAETQDDLTKFDIDMKKLTKLFFTTDTSDGGKDTSWYAQANLAGNPMVARFHSAMTYHALERALGGLESNNDNILKTMLALRSVENQRKKHGSGRNEFMNRITQCVSDPCLKSAWTNKVEESLKGLNEDDQGTHKITHQITKQLHRDIFSEQDGKINLSTNKLDDFIYKSNLGQLKFSVKNELSDPDEEFSLDAIAMTLNSNAPKYSDIPEKAKGVLKTVYYGDRDMGAGVHVCMGTDSSERADELMTKDKRFLVKGDTVWVKASTGTGIEWREHVEPTEELHQNLKRLEHLSVWQSGTTLYFYDQHMDCQYKVEENGPLIRLSDNKTLCAEKITAHGFASLTWTADDDGTTVVDMYKKGKKCVALTRNESMKYVNENGQELVGTTENQLIFKDGTMFEVWQFDLSGLKQVLRSEDPVSKSPIPVKAYDQATIASFTKPAGAMSTLMWMAKHPSKMNDALAWPSEKEVVPFDELTRWVGAHKSELGLMQQLQAHLDDLVIVDASGQAVEKGTVLRCMPPDSATPNDSNALMLLDAAVKRGDRDQINQLCGFIQERIDHVALTPTQRRVLAGLVAGISNDELKEAMGIVLDGVKVPSSRHIEAYRQLDKRDNNQLMFMANRTNYARGLNMSEDKVLDKDSATEFKNKVDQKYQILRSQLDNMLCRLGMDPKDPMSTSYLLNAMIQGDPNGLIPATMREDVERLALNAMFMHTESQYLGDVVGLNSKPDEATKLLGDNRHYVGLIDDVQKGLASPEQKRLLALLMRCEQKLGHRLRKEQYNSVMGFIEGKFSIAQLKTGFGKTDVLLFLLALYKGHGKGARVITPKTLIGMNATDYERKLQDFGVSVWQPSLNINEARVKDKPLEQFFEQLTMHKNRGDICFAPIEFDMQLRDLRSESQYHLTNESDAVKKGKLTARIDLLDRIQQTMGSMFSVVDEAPLVKNVNKEFNMKAGKERMFDQERVEFCEKATKAIFKDCPDLFKGDICEIQYKEKMKDIAQGVFNDVFGNGNVTVPSGESSFNLADGNDWRTHFKVSKDSKSPTNGQLGLVVRMLTSSALEVSKGQLNWQYGFRRGDNQSLTVVPYLDKDVPTEVGTSFQDKEITTMYTVLAIQQNKKGYFGDPSKVSGILSFMATNAQELCQSYPDVFKASPETELSQLMALAIDVQSAYQDQLMRELSSGEFDRLANAAMNDATDDPLAKKLRRLMDTIKGDDHQLNDLMFKVITNTKESERSFNANTNEIQTGHVQFSGTIDEGLIPAADLLRGNYETVKVAVKGLDKEQDLAAVNEHRFGSKTLEDAEILSNGKFNVIGVDNTSLKGNIVINPLIKTFLDKAEENNKVQLLVDSGALIQGLSNRQVAEHIQGNAKQVMIDGALYRQNVVYYDTETDQLRCITYDHGILSMPQLIAKVNGNEIRKGTIKAFFDQARATGTDIMKVLLDDVEIMLTASTGMEKNEWVQGFGRMRELGDKMHLVAPNSFVSEVQDGSEEPVVQIQHMWAHISKHTEMKMNQKILKRVQTELNGLIKDEVSKALKTLGTELTADEKKVVDGILCQTTSYDLSEFERPPKEISTEGALNEYLNRLLDEKRAMLGQLPTMFKGENNFLNGVQFQRVQPPFNRQNLSLEPPKKDGDPFDPKDIATAIIQSANHIKTGHLAASPLKVSDANTQAQAQAQAQATVQAQATAQAQSQAQAQATAEGSAEVGVFTPSSNGNLTCKKTLLKRVVLMDTLDKAVQGQLSFDQNPSLHQFLTHMNVTNSIRFSHGFLSQCDPGKMPVVHHIFKKDDQYYVFTSEEVAALKPQEKGYTDVHDALFHGELGLVDASRNEPDTMENGTLLALQCLIDGDHRTELQMASRLNQAYERIFDGLKEATTSGTTITTGITHLKNQLASLHGVDHFMATQLLGQLQAQVNEDPSVTLVATDGAFSPVTQKAKQPITIMGLVADGQMDDIKQKMNDAIKGHFWKQDVLTSPSTFRADLRTSMNRQMVDKHQKACQEVKDELQADWATLSTEAIASEIRDLEAQIAAKEDEKKDFEKSEDKKIKSIQAELTKLNNNKVKLKTDIATNDNDLKNIKNNIEKLEKEKKGKENDLESNKNKIEGNNEKKRQCKARLRNIQRDQDIDYRQTEIDRIKENMKQLQPKSLEDILKDFRPLGMKIEKAVEIVKIVYSLLTKGPFLMSSISFHHKNAKKNAKKNAELLASQFSSDIKQLVSAGKVFSYSPNGIRYKSEEFFKKVVDNMTGLKEYKETKDISELYTNFKDQKSSERRFLKKITDETETFENLWKALETLGQLTPEDQEALKDAEKQIEKLKNEIQEFENNKESGLAEEISEYNKDQAEDAIKKLEDSNIKLLQKTCIDELRINAIENKLIKELKKQNNKLQTKIIRQKNELNKIKQDINNKQSGERKMVTAKINGVDTFGEEIEDLKVRLTQKNSGLTQAEGHRADFKSGIPNKIKEKMTELVEAYGFSGTEDPKLLQQFCPTDTSGNILGVPDAILGANHDTLSITLPTFKPEDNQIIGSDGEVEDDLAAANFEEDPLMQLFIAVECEAGDWITDANGQQLQLSKDSKLIEETKKFRKSFNESNGEKVWFLLNSTLSLGKKLMMLKKLEGFKHLSEENAEKIISHDFLAHITEDIKASITSGNHSVIQAKDTFCVGLENSTSDVPCLLKKAERLATMTHLPGLA